MSTVRDNISRVRSLEKLLSADNSITDRVIMRELKSKAIFYIRRETDKRRLWQTSTIFSNIPCLEMKEVPMAECCEYVSNCTISRSKHKLPKISEGIFGLLVHGVFSVDGGKKLKETTISRYANLLKLGLPNDVYYWFYNQYLYVSAPSVKLINIWAYFEEDIADDLLYPPCPCANAPKKNPCLNPLDLEFKCPGYLEDVVVKDTVKTLMETYFRVAVDHTSDSKDDQVNKQ
jgi:hypothetical protein